MLHDKSSLTFDVFTAFHQIFSICCLRTTNNSVNVDKEHNISYIVGRLVFHSFQCLIVTAKMPPLRWSDAIIVGL